MMLASCAVGRFRPARCASGSVAVGVTRATSFTAAAVRLPIGVFAQGGAFSRRG
jgi:hypothetical protein